MFLDLMAIAEWLSLNDHDEFMNVYAAVRGSLMKRSLDLVWTFFGTGKVVFNDVLLCVLLIFLPEIF